MAGRRRAHEGGRRRGRSVSKLRRSRRGRSRSDAEFSVVPN